MEYEKQSAHLATIAMLGSAQSMLGMIASTGEEATSIQNAAFIAQKALAIAQIILNTELAAAQAMAIPGDTTKVIGIPLATMIRATGYASAGIVGALAISEFSGGGGSYSGAYDKGGWIPAGKWGVVGEYGPEMVHGPAHVTGRERTASKLGGESSGNLTIAPQINVTVQGSGKDGGSEEDGRLVGEAVKVIVVETLKKHMRPNGMLDSWARSRRG